MTFLFRPMGLISGLLAGLVASQIFERIWSAANDEEPPSPDQEALNLRKLVLALLLQGAIFSLVRGLVDHGARVAFRNYTGAWPGEEDSSGKES